MPSTLQRCLIASLVSLALGLVPGAMIWRYRRAEDRASHDRIVARWVADGGREASFTCPRCGTGGSLLTMSPPGGKESFPCRACGKPIPHP